MAGKWKKSYQCAMATAPQLLHTLVGPPTLGNQARAQSVAPFVGFMCSERGGRSAVRGSTTLRHWAHPQTRFMSNSAGGQDNKELNLVVPEAVPTHFTVSNLHGIDLDTCQYTSLTKLFKNHMDLCFENHTSTKGLIFFTPFSTSIFEKILFMAIEKKKLGYWMKLHGSQILVKYENNFVVDVAISTSVLVHKGDENCFYKDEVVGPFASMLYSETCKIVTNKDGLAKEICHLILMSSQIWWKSLDDIMSYALFWTIEQRFAGITCARMFMSDGTIKNPRLVLTSAPSRTFKLFDDVDWIDEFRKNDVYQEYSVSSSNYYEVVVNEATAKVVRVWTSIYAAGFPQHYNFGTSKKVFSRNSLHHFWDDNFNGYADMLERQTIKTAIIHADSEFNISLSTYKSLCKLEANPPKYVNPNPSLPRLERIDKDVLDISFRTSR